MMLAIGRITGTHGLRGDLKVESYSGEFEHFETLEEVTLRKGDFERRATVEGCKRSGGKLVLSLGGIDTVDAAGRLRGWEILAPREAAAPLGAEEYYIADLVGLAVVHRDETIGAVSAVYDGGQASLLEIDLGERKSLVPFLAIYFGDVDLDASRMELLEPWVLE